MVTNTEILNELQGRGGERGERITILRQRGVEDDKIAAALKGKVDITSPIATPISPQPDQPTINLGETSIFEKPLESPFSIQDITATGGGIVGGAAGLATGGPLGAFAGGVGGAALGGAFGESLEQIIAQIMGDPNAPQSSKEAAKRIGIEAAFEGALEAGGFGVAAGAQKVLRPFGGVLKTGAAEAIEAFKEVGGRFTPAQLSDNPLVQSFENVAEGSLFGAKKLIGFKQQQQEILDGMILTLRESLGTPQGRDTIGEMAGDVISENSRLFRTQADVLYGQVDRLTQDAVVDFRGMKRLADSLRKDATLAGTLGGASDALRLLDEVAKFDDFVSFKQAQAIRSGLLDEKRGLSTVRNKAFGVASQLAKGADDVIQKGGGRLEGDALKKWREANKFWKSGKEVFDDRYIKALSRLDPEQVGRSVFANARPTRVRKLKRILDAKSFKDARAGWLSDALNKSFTEGDFVGKAFKRQVESLGKESYELMFSPLERKSIDNIMNVATTLQRRSAVGGQGKTLIQLAQGGAAVTMFTQGFEKGAAAILLTPYVMAQIVSNPLGAKLLSQGFKVPAGTAAATAASGRLLDFIEKMGLRDQIQEVPLDSPNGQELLQSLKNKPTSVPTSPTLIERGRIPRSEPLVPAL
jgi:hypothetical protein